MMKLIEIDDVTLLQGMVSDLWCLLDHIDTLDDACKEKDDVFRHLARQTQQRRHSILTSDGYDLFKPSKGA